MAEAKEITVEDKLKKLYELQKVVSQIDNLRAVRGELPLEVNDLQDQVLGLSTRIDNIREDIDRTINGIGQKKAAIEESNALIAKYKSQQDNVRNNREYENLSKEIEYQGLEVQLCERRIKEGQALVEQKQNDLKNTEEMLADRTAELEQKKKELETIMVDTQVEEDKLSEKAQKLENKVNDPRLIEAFHRIRSNARNGLAIVSVQRDACGGCYNRIPLQRKADIKMHKHIVVCEYCGRILVDPEFVGEKVIVTANPEDEPKEKKSRLKIKTQE